MSDNYPTHNTAVVEQAKGRLLAQYGDTPYMHALIDAMGAQVQELEDTSWDLLTKLALPTATGYQLDRIGVLLDQSRGGLDDTTYRQLLYIRIAELNSEGTIEDVVSIFKALTGADRVRLIEIYPAKILLEAEFTSYLFNFTAAHVRQAIQQTKPAGVGFEVSAVLPQHFGFQGDPNALGYGTLTDPSLGGHYAALLA